MTEIRKYRIYLLILLLLVLPLFSPLLNSILKENEKFLLNDGQDKISTPKSSGFWDMGPLHIKDSGGGGDYTWAQAVGQVWCSGDGSLNNPYLLENITIDAGGSESGILIENSNGKYFTIRNCTVMNAGTIFMANAGIKLLYSSNGTVVENNCLNNIKSGIMLEYGNFNNITNNYIYNSSGVGVRLYQSDHNEVLENNIIEGGTNSEGIMIDSTSEFNVISDNDVSNQWTGIRIAATAASNNTIVNNWLFNNSHIGINISPGCNNNTIELNKIQNSSYGLRINGDGNIFFRNILSNNTQNAEDWGNYNQWDNGSIGNYWDDYGGSDLDDDGIGDTPYAIDFGENPDNFPIWNDGFNGSRIHIDDTGFNSYDWETASKLIWCTGSGTFDDPYTIENIAIDAGNVGSPIFIESSSVYFVIKNCNLTNSQATGNDAGIKFEDVYNGKVFENNITDNYAGVKLIRSDNNSISANYIYDNAGQGIILQQSKYNVIVGNTANNSNYYGLLIVSASHNNTIEGNTFGNNKGASGYGSGIRISGSSDCEVSGNLLSDNDQGIRITDNSHRNTFYDNIIHNNAKYGVLMQDLTRNCNNSVFYNNSIINHLGINAYDDGSSSEWDNGIHGNFWSDYGGADNNGDGIGDTPYLISGDANSQDNYPAWSEGDDTYPTISIITPLGGTIFGSDAPTYSLNIFDLYLNMSWYTLNNSASRYFFTPTNGINGIAIDETEWDSFAGGFILMTFYVNDSSGNTASVSNVIEKDATNPTITVNSPLGGTVFGSDAPEFNLTIYDPNLHDAWYTLGSSVTQHSFSHSNGINIVPIDESSWDALPEGSITINFFVNDTVGNFANVSYMIIKDTTDPTITLNSPLGGTIFDTNAPEFNITINDLHLHDAWYTIGTSVTQHSFSPSNGINIIQIDESSWDALSDGSVPIHFFVNDTVGNIHTISVTIAKDTELPSSVPEPAIPFGNYYILFLVIGIATLLLVEHKKRKK